MQKFHSCQANCENSSNRILYASGYSILIKCKRKIMAFLLSRKGGPGDER
jgi:hypothetical protein